MEMHQIRYFLALCEEQSFTGAAKRCGVSQPSLTDAIKRLEQTLGGPLFHRNRPNTRLTDLGIVVRPDLVSDRPIHIRGKAQSREICLSALSTTRQPRAMEPFMRARHVIAVVAVLIIGLGAKLYLFPPKHAEADQHAVAATVTMDVRALEAAIDIKALPEQNFASEADPDVDADNAPIK